MSLEKTVQELRELLNCCSSDLQKTERGNRAAAQRVRTGTVKLEKVAKRFRKESVAEEKSGNFRKFKEAHRKGQKNAGKKASKSSKKSNAKQAKKSAPKKAAPKQKTPSKKKVTKAPVKKLNLKKPANRRQNRPSW